MGACYSVDLTVKFTDAAQAAAALKSYITRNPDGANFGLPRWAECGIGTEKLDDLLAIMLAGWPGQRVRKEEEPDGFISYRNDFDASYGWQRIMEAMFRAMAAHLADGSEFYIGADNAETVFRVEGGEVC